MLGRLLSNLALGVALLLSAVMLVPAALGVHHYVILTGSMTGTYDPGSLVFDRPVPTSSLRVGDVITYAPPPGASPNQKLVTHRIVRITTSKDGKRVFQTKGDANPVEDQWKFLLPQPTQDRVIFHIPDAGFAFELLSVRAFRTALIGLPAFGLALWFLLGMWRDAGDVVRRRDEAVRPWGADVARRLPLLMPLVEGDPGSGRATVRVPLTWTPARVDERRRAPAGEAGPLATALADAAAARAVTGRVVLPDGCRARARARSSRRPLRALPPGWRLEPKPRLLAARSPEAVA